MTTILKEMGIQQWRLRRANAEPTAQVDQTYGLDEPQASVERVFTEQAPVEQRIQRPGQASITKPTSKISTPTSATIAPMPAPAPMPLSPVVPAPLSINSEIVVAQNVLPKTLTQLDWQGLQTVIDGQGQCPTCGDDNASLGAGDANANWLFVSDAPSRSDVKQQQLFSGRVGQLYEAMLSAVNLSRTQVYTTTVFKCAASDDLSVVPNCDKLLQRQIELLKPQVIIAFGEFVAQSVAKSNEDLETLRSQNLHCYHSKVPIIATYSPLQLLDAPHLKSGAWADLKKCIAITR